MVERRDMRRFLVVLLLVPRLVRADAPKLSLDQVIEKAVANPKIEMAEGDQASAAARVDEADASRLPRLFGRGLALRRMPGHVLLPG